MMSVKSKISRLSRRAGSSESHVRESPWRPCKVVFRSYVQKYYSSNPLCQKGPIAIFTLSVIGLWITLSSMSTSTITIVCGGPDKLAMRSYSEVLDNDTKFSLPNRHLPHGIIVGARKTGTRALVKFLSIHPEIVAISKELHFFDQDKNYHQGLDYYMKLMPYSFQGQITIEKTAAYFTDFNTPERIYGMNSSIKLLFMVRDPVLRLVSDYTQLREAAKKNKKQSKSFEDEVLTKKGEVNTNYKPVQISLYYNFMKRWMQLFNLKQVHIIDGDIFETDPYSEIRKIESFLGVGHLLKTENFFLNQTKGFFCINGGGPIAPCLQNFKRSKYPNVSPGLVKKLYKFYEPHNKSFFKFVNRTFDWDKMDDFLENQKTKKVN